MERRTIGEREVLLEFQRVGEFVKVTAIDPVTLREVSIVGSPRASEAELTRLVLRKLDFVEAKETGDAHSPPGGRAPGGGIEV
jgi:hypothetical protein